jgi:acylphosphatase
MGSLKRVRPIDTGVGPIVRSPTVLSVGHEAEIEPMSDRARAHVFVSGRVQGVFYRANTRDTARDLGVDGWVRNLDDGRVEAIFEGPQEYVEEMVDWCHDGSPSARVEDVDVEYEEPQGADGFRIKR